MEEALYENAPMRQFATADVDQSDSGRDHDPQLPPVAGNQRAGPGDSGTRKCAPDPERFVGVASRKSDQRCTSKLKLGLTSSDIQLALAHQFND